jgi:hypothetical protein
MTNNYERIPEELKHLRQWHVWKQTDKTKIPVQINGAAAKSNDPETWTDFETAVDCAPLFSGLAFEITEPYTGIDLDNCIDEDGQIRQWAWPILFRFDGIGYAEVSPSGSGIKILTRARKTAGSRSLHKIADGKQQIECYDRTRFWTMTGDVYSGNETIGDGQQALEWLCEEYLSEKQKQPEPQKPKVQTIREIQPVTLERPVLRRAREYVQSCNGTSEGSRNSTGFRLAGHLYAFDSDGDRLTAAEVYDLLRDWNRTNPDPLSDFEIEKLCRSAMQNGTPRERKLNRPLPDFQSDYSTVDISGIVGEPRTEDFDDEEFCANSVPESGLLRDVYEYYCLNAHRLSHVMGLACAVSLCETIFGRRITSHTDMRTNDYNVVMAPTASGKENCETTLSKILHAASPNETPMLPPDVQSGNGLLKAVSVIPCAVWVCDEFGKVLEAILDKKSNNGHAKAIGLHLLKLYGKSSGIYGGAAHADGTRNEIKQPHLVLLGLTTGQIFESVDSKQVQDGLLGRIAFWPVQERPRKRNARFHAVPETLSSDVREWLLWTPHALNPDDPMPPILEMREDALERWNQHSDKIDEKMQRESESRAAIWGRVNARAMKLAIVHRCARMTDNPALIDWQFLRVELQDIDWGIRLANWLGRVACGLIRENVVDVQHERAKKILRAAVDILGEVDRRSLLREYRSITASEFSAAAEWLSSHGEIEIETQVKKKVVYKKPKTQVT